MKRQSIKGLAFFAVTATIVTSCDQLKDLSYTVTPNPLEMHGDSVRVKVEVAIPEKGIKKKASAEITPTLASTSLKPVTIQGEKATGNGTVIQYKPGGKFTYTDVVAYKSDMEVADLMVTGKVYKGGKEKEGAFEPMKIADATIITPYLVNKDFRVIYEKDQFKRVTEEKAFAQINYDKGKSNVKPGELKDADMTAYSTWLGTVQTNPKVAIKSINITGYASPEGEEDKNNTLSTDRSNTAKTSTMEVAKKAKNEKAQTEVYTLKGSGEDFEGFKRELNKSTTINEDERNLIIRVLEMNADPAKREEEMRAMGKTFTYLDKNIFPLLRRAEISTVYDLTGYSDEELKAISASNPDSLKLEELLFTATLTEDLNEKMRLYQVAAKNFPQDHRPVNNIGAVLYQQNKVAEAKVQFEKANGMKDNAISKNNLAAVAGVNGDRKKAAQLLGQASGAGEEVKYNQGILNIQDGDYAAAVSNLGSEATFNKGLAQLLNGSPAETDKTINNSPDAETAQGLYLKAIAAARQDKLDLIVSNLKNCFAKDGAWKAKAAKDREFLKYAENAAFSGIVK